MRKLTSAVLAGALLFAIAGPASAATRAPSATATLNVVHGIPDVDVNVCVNGSVAIPDFSPGEVVSGVELPEGAYDVKIVGVADACTGTAILEADGVPLAGGKSYTAVAHLEADGTPTLGLFKNNVRPVAKGTARLIVRHTAAAPAVDVWANGGVIARDLGNGETFRVVVPKGVYAAWVSLPGDHQPVIGPAVLKLVKGHTYELYAWGNGSAGYGIAVVDTLSGTA
jgi:hypothetical protein